MNTCKYDEWNHTNLSKAKSPSQWNNFSGYLDATDIREYLPLDNYETYTIKRTRKRHFPKFWKKFIKLEAHGGWSETVIDVLKELKFKLVSIQGSNECKLVAIANSAARKLTFKGEKGGQYVLLSWEVELNGNHTEFIGTLVFEKKASLDDVRVIGGQYKMRWRWID